MAEGWAKKIQGCFYAVLSQPTCDGGLRRSTVAHFARKVRGTNIATAKHCNSNKVMARSADYIRYVFVALTLRAK